MAKVRLPGSLVTHVFECDEGAPEDEQSSFTVKVLTYDEWRIFSSTLFGLHGRSSGADILDACKKALGIALVAVTNLKVAGDGAEEAQLFELKKVGTDLTKESMTLLMPFKDEILKRVQEASQVTRTDLKN